MTTEAPSLLNLPVPDFSAEMTSGKTFKLSDYRGKNVLLYFYPKDNTPGCTTEGMDFRNMYEEFQENNTEIFGISRDSMKSHENFKAKLGMPFELISDPDEALCTMFDVIKLKNMYGKKVRGIVRSTFLINPEGVLVQEWRGVKVPGHINEVLDYIKSHQ